MQRSKSSGQIQLIDAGTIYKLNGINSIIRLSTEGKKIIILSLAIW